jgi:ubiquinone/menaquinone biosynthesis C-methylase UbiE
VIDYDRIAVEYARHRKVHPGVLRSLISRSGIDGDSRVLEVGCGTGNYIRALQDAVGCSCWAIDPSEEMLAAARDRCASVNFHAGRAEQLDFEPAFFDLVFSVDVIHHVDDHAAHFGEVQRVLRPGGRVCTVTDSGWIIRNREPLAVYFPETVEVDLRRYPRLTVLRALMQGAGFRHIEEELLEFRYEVADPSPYADKAFSSLHLISEEAFQRGLQRVKRDLRVGPIAGVSRYVLLWGHKG